MKLIPADRYSFEELTESYNQTRVDYLVPMPMNVARLREYATTYDIKLESSFVAVSDDKILGLAMLGIREERTWITRLGVLPDGRCQGVGRSLMEALLAESHRLGARRVWLEVIKGNEPAHRLFTKMGFSETRELIIARRPPRVEIDTPPTLQVKRVTSLDHEEALILLAHRQERPNWLNESETMQNARNLSALLVEFTNGDRGWVTYHAGLLQLTRINVEATRGDTVEVTAAVLHSLHQRYPRQDAIAENVVRGPLWDGFKKAGYFDAFRRIEMINHISPADQEE